MRRFAVAFFLPVLVLGLLVWWLVPLMQQDPGYVLIAVAGKIIEMRFWFALALLVGLSLTIGFCARTLSRGWRGGRDTWRRLRGHHESVSIGRLQQALSAEWRGEPVKVYHALRALAKSPLHANQWLPAYQAAEAALAAGLCEEADAALTRAIALAPAAERVRCQCLRARLLQQQGQVAEAETLLRELLVQNPKHLLALVQLDELLALSGQPMARWALLPRLQKAKQISPEAARAIEQQAFVALLHSGPKVDEAKTRYADLSKAAKQDPDTLAAYARYLAPSAFSEADSLLRRFLKDHYHPAVALAFAALPVTDASGAYQYLARWLGERERNLSLQLALARLARQADLWGKAREHYQGALRLLAQPKRLQDRTRRLQDSERLWHIGAEFGQLLTEKGLTAECQQLYRDLATKLAQDLVLDADTDTYAPDAV